MKMSGVMSGAAVLALVAGLAWAGDDTVDSDDSDEGRPGHSDPWPGDDGGDGWDPDPGDDFAGPPGGDRPDDDDLSVMPIWHDDGSCADCDFADDEAREVAITAAPGAPGASERREARRDWRELHQANRRNVCFEADLYVPALCDWQRPFLGERMP
jgi:hypothetical protein